MKKKLMLAIMILASFVFITNARADTLSDKYISVLTFYKTTEYYENYPYCIIYENNNFLYCHNKFSPAGFYSDGNYVSTNGSYLRWAYYYNSSTGVVSTNTNSTTTSRADFTNSALLFGFDFYKSNNTLVKFADFDITSIGSPQTPIYTITFDVPRNSVVTVKDSNNDEVTATSQYVYELESGNYTYSVSNSLYTNITNVSFTVSEDTTINVTMTERLNPQPIRSVYSQYYNYISELVNKVFDIENPIFLFFVSFIIGFSLIILIKRLIGGLL